LRGGVRDRAADPEALGPHPRAGAAVAAGLPRLRVRPSSLRRAGDPRADQSRGRRRRPRLDALEPAQRLHQRRAQAEGGPRGQVRLLLVVALILTAALLVASFAGAELPPNELGRVMILEYHKIDYPEARWTRTPLSSSGCPPRTRRTVSSTSRRTRAGSSSTSRAGATRSATTRSGTRTSGSTTRRSSAARSPARRSGSSATSPTTRSARSRCL